MLTWIILGLIAGILARWIMPGRQSFGLIMTILLGIMGAVLGGFLGKFFGIASVDGINLKSVLLAAVGAVIILWIGRKLRR